MGDFMVPGLFWTWPLPHAIQHPYAIKFERGGSHKYGNGVSSADPQKLKI